MKKETFITTSDVACEPIDKYNLQRDRFRVFIEDVAEGFYETDLKGYFKFFNHALCRIFGYSREELLNHNYREFQDEENAKLAYESMRRLYENEDPSAKIKWEIIRRDGERRILEISAQLIYNPQGERVGYRGIARDVTEAYRVQERLIASEKLAREQYAASQRAEKRYRAFLNFLQDPVMVLTLDNRVSYLNPAFEKVFGWRDAELRDKRIPFVPDYEKEKTRKGISRLIETGVLIGFESRRYTKDGRVLDVWVNGAVFYDENNERAGQVHTMRDVTREKRTARAKQTLFEIADALHHYPALTDRLFFITHQIRHLMNVDRAHVILLDKDRREFYFRASSFSDKKSSFEDSEIRVPADQGAMGQVYRTGKPLLIRDYYSSPFALPKFFKLGVDIRDLLQVPIWVENRMIGVLSVVNKRETPFDPDDVELLETVASMVALPIENARINEELFNSYKEIQSLNRAKDHIIHHLSHELKTPVAVMSASLELLNNKLATVNASFDSLVERLKRNLKRILEMQYELEDIQREPDYRPKAMLSVLLDTCRDELESLVSAEAGENAADRVRRRLDEVFGSPKLAPENIQLGSFVRSHLATIRPLFSHRRLVFTCEIKTDAVVRIPDEILQKILTGLVKNAVEYTPDGGCVAVTADERHEGPVLVVEDTGIGITEENQRLIFENYFTTSDILQYSTGNPYDFNAGGRGFDLLRMKIFSERYHFKILLESNRCRHLQDEDSRCPGQIENCGHCEGASDCSASGGTRFTIQFLHESGHERDSVSTR